MSIIVIGIFCFLGIKQNMKTDEEKVMFATSVAMQLAKGLDEEEIEELRCLLNQIIYSLSTLVGKRRLCKHDKKRF